MIEIPDGKPDAGKLARPVRGGGWGNRPLKGGTALCPYSTGDTVRTWIKKYLAKGIDALRDAQNGQGVHQGAAKPHGGPYRMP